MWYPEIHEGECGRTLQDDYHFCAVSGERMIKNSSVFRIGADVNHAEIMTVEEETLWSAGVLRVSFPKALLRAIFFLNGKNFIACEEFQSRDNWT